LGSFRKIEVDAERVLQADGLKDRSKLMKAIGPLMQDPEIEIEFGEGRNSNLHRRQY
jgi:hypothetical protein